MLRAVLCGLALGAGTVGAFQAPPGRLNAGWSRTTELKSTNDLYGPPPGKGGKGQKPDQRDVAQINADSAGSSWVTGSRPPAPRGSAGAPATGPAGASMPGSAGASGAGFFGGAFSVADALAGAAGAPPPSAGEAAQRQSAAAMSEAMYALQRELDAEKGKPNKNYKHLKHIKSLMDAQSVVDEQQALLDEKAAALRAKLLEAEQKEDYERCEELQAELEALMPRAPPNQYGGRGQGQGQYQGQGQGFSQGMPGGRRPSRREGLVQRTRGEISAYSDPMAGYGTAMSYDPYAMSLGMYPSGLQGYNQGYAQGGWGGGPYNQGYGGDNWGPGYNTLGRRSRRDEITERTRGAFNGQGPQQGQARYNQGYNQYPGQAMGQTQGFNSQYRGQGQGVYNQGYNQNFKVQGPTAQGPGQGYYQQFGGQGQYNGPYSAPYNNQGYRGGRRQQGRGYPPPGGFGGYGGYGGYRGQGDRGQDRLS